MAIGQKVADIYAQFGLDDKQFQKGLREANKNIKGTKTNIFDLEKSFKLAWAAMSAAVIAGATRIGMESIKLASDMRELDNVFQVFLGQNADKYSKKADELGKAMGRSSFAMRSMTSQGLALAKSTGVVGEAMGETSLKISELAVDLASLYNTSDQQAFNALASALRGEQEPLRKYNILLSDATLNQFALQKGLSKTTKEMSEQEKASLRLQFIFENSTEAQGDAVRTSQEFANQLKRLRGNLENIGVSIGNNLIDPLGKTLIYMNEFLDISSEFFQGETLKIEIDDNSFKTALKSYLNFGLEAEKIWNGILSIVDTVGEEVGRGITAPLKILSRPFEDFAKQRQQSKDIQGQKEDLKEQSNIYNLAAKIEENRENYFNQLKENNKKQNELTNNQINALKQSFSNIEDLGSRLDLTSLDIQKNKLSEIDSVLKEAVGSDKYTSVFVSYLTAQRKILVEEIKRTELMQTQKEVAMQNAEAIKKSIEAEIEKQRIEKEAQENRAKNIELDKQIYKSENDLKNTQRELQLREINQINQLKNAFQGLSETKAEEKFAELENNLVGNQEALILLNLVFEDYINSITQGTDDVLTAEDKLKNLSNSMSDTAKIIEDLSEIFDNDLLPVLSNTISTISSSLMSLSTGGLGAVSGAIGLIGAGLAVYNYITDDSDLIESQKEADENFSKAVDDFRRAVNEFSIGQQISYAQLQRPTNLGNLASISNRDIQGIDLGIYGEFDPTKYLLRQIGGGTTQDLDVSKLQQALNESGYGNINARAIFEKFATRDTVRTGFLGLDKEEVVTYDEAKAIAEINKLIEEAYRLNLDNFKNAVGLTEQAFSSALISAFKNGGDVEQAITEVMKNAMITAVFSAEAFSQVSSLLGDKISEKLFESLDISVGDLENMGIEDLTNLLISLFGEGAEFLNEMFEELGWNVDSVNKEFQQLTGSTQNLPAGSKIQKTEFLSTQVPGTTIVIQGQVYGDNVESMLIRANQKAQGLATGNYGRRF